MQSLHLFLKAYVECIFNWEYVINIKSDVSFSFGNKHKKHDKYKHSLIHIYELFVIVWISNYFSTLVLHNITLLTLAPMDGTYLKISITLTQTSGMRFSSSHFQMKDGCIFNGYIKKKSSVIPLWSILRKQSLCTHIGTEIHNVRSRHPVACDILALRQICWVRMWYSSAKKNLTLWIPFQHSIKEQQTKLRSYGSSWKH